MHPLFKQIARHVVFPAIYALGLQRLLSAFSPHDKLILCYHGVEPGSSMPFNGRHISPENFERQLAYFKANFQTLSFSELFELYRRQQTPDRPAIALTFDDGYLNNYNHALPLLEQYEIPATFFVSGICLEQAGAPLWPDVIDLLRHYRAASGIQLDGMDFRPRKGIPFRLFERSSGISLIDYIKGLGVARREALMENLISRYDFYGLARKHGIDYWRLMDQQQLQALAASPWAEIGSHAHRHYNLANIAPADAQYELTHSKALLENALQREITCLAFPDGNYNAEVKSMSLQAGYRYLAAVNYLLPEDKDDPHILPRENISGTTNYYSQIIHLHYQMPRLGF